MKIVRIPTENPQLDQWRLLGQFAYPANIRKYLSQNSVCESNSELEEYIAGCINQAESYFIAAERASLDISPLLLYYGASNLLIGATSLIKGEIKDLSHHGMRIELPKKEIKKQKSLKAKLHEKRRNRLLKSKYNNSIESETIRIADYEIIPEKPTFGALQHFCNVFSNGCQITFSGSWTVEEIFGSVPDLRKDFEICYENAIPFTIPVELKQMDIDYRDKEETKREITYERIDFNDIRRINNPIERLFTIEGFLKSYLKPQQKYGENQPITLFRKIHSKEICFYTIYGEKFLELPHEKNGRFLVVNQLIILLMGLFALGSISRYKPHIWNPFVKADVTGERLLVEKFISICQRYMPNLVLNFIRKQRIEFYHPTNIGLLRKDMAGDSD
jgi:hypothetical protein